VVELDAVFAAVVSAFYDDTYIVIRLSSYKREHGLLLININAATDESPILQLNAARVVWDELRVLVGQMQQCANSTAKGDKEILAHYCLVLNIIHFFKPNMLKGIARRQTPYTHWLAGC
jgi:hypothetical protein